MSFPRLSLSLCLSIGRESDTEQRMDSFSLMTTRTFGFSWGTWLAGNPQHKENLVQAGVLVVLIDMCTERGPGAPDLQARGKPPPLPARCAHPSVQFEERNALSRGLFHAS